MKIVNLILGLGTAVIISSLIVLGIRAFHPEPVSPWENRISKPYTALDVPCDKGDTKCWQEEKQLREEQAAEQLKFQEEDRAYQNRLKDYNRDVFIIANIVGIAVFIGGFYMLFATAIASQSVPIGIMLAGLWGIVYGYSRGWGSTNDQLKFFVGLVIAAMTIGGSIWLVERYYKKTKDIA